jgi:hypothetical protein
MNVANEQSPDRAFLPRYNRILESTAQTNLAEPIPFEEAEQVIRESSLSPGARDIARSLLRWAQPRVFPGGGLGLDYGPLFKTAARPDLLGRHITEVSEHLRGHQVDLLVVPGMSGYPIGAMYSQASCVPAVLLKKQTHREIPADPPPGAFLIPSYTGSDDTLISADMAAVESILEESIARQLAAGSRDISIRIAGADEIIDKATMATAITETAPQFCRAASQSICDRLGASAAVSIHAEVVAWVTPLIKTYNRSQDILRSRFNITPFAGIALTSLQADPPAVGIEGLGVMAFAPRTNAS